MHKTRHKKAIMLQKTSILLIGYDSNLCLGVLYCLKSLNADIYLLTSNKKNAARFSIYLKKTYEEYDKNGIQQIKDIVKAHNIGLIMPIDELEIRNIKLHTEELSKIAICSWGTEVDRFDIAINKMKLAKFLTEHNVPCPKFAVLEDLEKLKKDAEDIGYPVLVKPDREAFGRLIQRFENWEELKDFYMENETKLNRFILQPFIIGSDVTCNVICREGELICYTIQESPVKTGNDFSSNDILRFHDDEQVISVIAKMMKLLNWHGVACIDMRRDIRDNSVKVLEINGRFWASVISSYVRAGINFPVTMVKLALAKEVDPFHAKQGQQLTLKQVISSTFTKNRSSIKDTKYISYLADPFARIAQLLKI